MSVTMIVARRPDGLGTRLACLMCAKQFADFIGVELKAIWPAMTDHGYDFSLGLLQGGSELEIFSSPDIFGKGEDSVFIEPQIISSLSVFQVSDKFWPQNVVRDEQLAEIKAAYDVILFDIPAPLYFEGRDRNIVDSEIKGLWSRTAIHPEIVSVYENSMNGRLTLADVAVHLRRGDMEAMLLERDLDFLRSNGMTIIFQRYLPLKSAAQLIREHTALSDHILVCSEDQNAKLKLVDQLPEFKISDTNDTFEINTNKRAVLDLLVLSRSKILLAPYKSFFSECAALLGHCHLIRSDLFLEDLTDELEYIIKSSSVMDKNDRLCVLYDFVIANIHDASRNEFKTDVISKLALVRVSLS